MRKQEIHNTKKTIKDNKKTLFCLLNRLLQIYFFCKKARLYSYSIAFLELYF